MGHTHRGAGLEDVRVPDANRIGEVGNGPSVALPRSSAPGLGAAAQAVGIAQGAIDYATRLRRLADRGHPLLGKYSSMAKHERDPASSHRPVSLS